MSDPISPPDVEKANKEEETSLQDGTVHGKEWEVQLKAEGTCRGDALVTIATREGDDNQEQTTLSVLNASSAAEEDLEHQPGKSCSENEQADTLPSVKPDETTSFESYTENQLVNSAGNESGNCSHTPPSPGLTPSLPWKPADTEEIAIAHNGLGYEEVVSDATHPAAASDGGGLATAEGSDEEVVLNGNTEKKTSESSLVATEVEVHPLLWKSRDDGTEDKPTGASSDPPSSDSANDTSSELSKKSPTENASQGESSVCTDTSESNLAAAAGNGSQQEAPPTVALAALPSLAMYPSLPTAMEAPPTSSTQQKGQMFSGIIYLGSSTVDAPVSEPEANRKMAVLKQQAGQPMPIILFLPEYNTGDIVLIDPDTKNSLASYPIRYVLFCARGRASSNLNDCFGFNVLHRTSRVYHCHVFRCVIPEECQKVFDTIGKAFKNKPPDHSQMYASHELEVMVELHEEDGRGNYVAVNTDKDCFRLRPLARKKVIVTISQNTAKALAFDKCYGLLMAVGKDLKKSELNLLDNLQRTTSVVGETTMFAVAAFWDTSLPFLSSLLDETAKGAKYQFLTVAVDVAMEGITEILQFKREVKVRLVKSDPLASIFSKKRLSLDMFYLTLERVNVSSSATKFKVKSLRSAREAREEAPLISPSLREHSTLKRTTSNAADDASNPSPSLLLKRKHSKLHATKSRDGDHGGEDSDEQQDAPGVEDPDEVDIIVSGWGTDDNDLREELLKQWHDILEKWDSREKWDPRGDKPRPKNLVKLIRKGIPSPLRCQIWQMLSGADSDPQLMEAYRLLVTKESPAENVINWDVKRTYVGHGFFQDDSASGGKEALYKISKAYSVYDAEVGYCQGFSFMAAVLLLQKMPEEQAFAVLVKIMFNYGHRNLFRCNFQNLHLMFFQLERLMEEYLHELYDHFTEKKVETHMYASQWFLTIFTAKFPLSMTYHVMDIFLCEGLPVVFQIALALLKITSKELLALDFEGILNYFRASLPKKFGSEEECSHLFRTAFSIKVTQRKLKKLEKDYQIYLEQLAQEEDPLVRMERENKNLRETILRLQRENDDLAEELVSSKVALRGDMDKLEERIDTLCKESRAHKSSAEASHLLISELREELQQAKTTYQMAMIQLTEERQQHEAAVAQYKQLFQELDQDHLKQKEDLSQELMEVKAKLGTLSAQATGADPSMLDHLTSLSSEQRLRELELELAQTKLALVEAQCKNQELEHRTQEQETELSQLRGRTSWLSKFSDRL